MGKSILVNLTWWQLLMAASVVVSGAPKADPKLVVTTTVGDVQGFLKHTFFKNVKYESYRAIRYAEPPIGDLRFKAPKPKKATKTVHGSSDKYGDSCIEYPFDAQSKKTRSEDCLFLNVFKPVNVTKGVGLPVIFFIHGGSFIQGDGTDSYYGPDFLMEKGGVILVTINYRLYAFGFLRIDDEGITGNMALKDVKLALRWTHDNIEKFGGDKDSITAIGQSSGAIAAHFLLLNEESASMIKRIVVISGSALLIPPNMSAWNHQSILFQKFKIQLNNSQDVDNLKIFLRDAPVQTILQLEYNGKIDGNHRMFWCPCVEKKTDKNRKPFFTQHPRFIYNKLNISTDVMFGVTSLEWGAFETEQSYQNFLQEYNNRQILKGVRFFDVGNNKKLAGFDDAMDAATSLIRGFYFKDQDFLLDSPDMHETYLKLMSDQGRAYPMDVTVQFHSEKSNGDTHYYYFDVDLELNYCKKNVSLTVPGATHGEDIPYFMFATKLKETYKKLKSSSDAKFVKTMVACRAMTDFIVEYAQNGFKGNKHGYKPVSAKPKVMNGILITNDGAKPIVDPNKEAIQMWNKAYEPLKKYITYK